MLDCLCTIIFWIGFYRLTLAVFHWAQYVKRHFNNPGLNLLARYGEGSYAVVTGATGGIGSEFSKQLAKKGFNLVMIDMNQASLEELSQTIRSQNENVKIMIIESDFSKATDSQFYSQIVARFEDLDVSLFVNNAGMTNYRSFHSETTKNISDIVKVNSVATAMFLKLMIERFMKRTKRSGVINISSVYSKRPLHTLLPYSCTKAFLRYLSEGVNQEVGNKIDIYASCPGPVNTKILGGLKFPTAIEPSE